MKRRVSALFQAILVLIFCILPVAASSVDDAGDRTGAMTPAPGIEGGAAYVVNVETGRAVYEKNIHEKMYPGGIVKIMAALVIVENVPDLDAVVTVTKSAIDDAKGMVSSGLKEGEEMSVLNLLYCGLIQAGADAMSALAEYVGGSVPEFVEMMNKKGRELGLSSTNFANPHGLHSDGQYSTAYDIYKYCRAAYEMPKLAEIMTIQYKRIPATNLSSDRYFYSNNSMVISADNQRNDNYYLRYANGMMSTFTNESGYCVAASAKKGDLSYICIVLGSTRDPDTRIRNSFVDAKKLLEWAFDSYAYVRIAKAREPIHEAEIRLSSTHDAVLLIAPEDYWQLIPAHIDTSELEAVVTLEGEVTAPVGKGDVLGRVEYRYGDESFGGFELVAAVDVGRSSLLFFMSKVTEFLSSRVFKISVALLAGFAVIYIILLVTVNSRRMKGRRRRASNAKKRSGKRRS